MNEQAAAPGTAEAEKKPGARAIIALAILSCTVGLNTVDRNMFGLLLPQIQQDIAISDSAMGLLVGAVFMIVYSVSSLPIAWLADRTGRRNVIAAGLGFWSIVTALTGFAQNLAHLVMARMALGVGEASNMAPTSALIGDMFRGRYRVIAMSAFAAGGPLAIMIFFPIIGWVTAEHSWRAAYPLMGAVGILVAVATLLAVREPEREQSAITTAPKEPAAGLLAATIGILRIPGFLMLAAAGTMVSINLGATLAWLPAFMQRVHGLDAAETGLLLGAYKGGFGVAATLAAGVLVTYLMRFDRRWLAWAPMLFALGLVPAQLLLVWSDNPALWQIGLALDSIFMSAIAPCLFALLLTLLDPSTRATGAALYLLIFNLVGQSLGPLLVGALSDNVFAAAGDEAVRYSLLAAPLVAALAGLLLFVLSTRRETASA